MVAELGRTSSFVMSSEYTVGFKISFLDGV